MLARTHRSKVRVWMLLVLGGLVGCQATPAVVTKPAVPQPSVIWFCGHEMPADQEAIRTEVRRHVGPGLPVESARERLGQLGFYGLYAGVYKEKPVSYLPAYTLTERIFGRDPRRDKNFHSLICRASGYEIGHWNQYHYLVTVSLPYDESGLITEVEVACSPLRTGRYANFFARHPDLHEPLGLPIEQAQALMQAHKFHCAYKSPEKGSAEQRHSLNCYAYDEYVLGGIIVRVQLLYDETRTVTGIEVAEKPGDFDGLRCMLPNNSDTVAGGIVKAVVFPVRLYTVIVVAGVMANLAMGSM